MSPSGRPPDLFDAAARAELERRAPLAARMRPRSLDEVVGQSHLLGAGAPLRVLLDGDRLSSAIFFGPPGTGKTTVAQLAAARSSKSFVPLSAVTAGVRDVRDNLDAARARLGQEGRGTILFLDEIHRFSRSQQDALLPGVEDGTVVLIGATTENPFFSLNAPLLSRSTLWRFEPLGRDELAELARRAAAIERVAMGGEALAACVELAEGDARAVLTTLEVAASLARARARGGPAGDGGGEATVSLAEVEAARTTRALRHGRDEHYDVVSALIKSLRGSDPDAGVYWLARLLAAGEDPRFVARRLVILASEDVGMADPTALLVAEAAARAVDRIGLPEAALNLAQAVVHLATAPKSNRAAAALWGAQSDVASRPAGAVPAHLRDAHYAGAAALGHGVGYDYPHDDPRGWVDAEYLPAELAGTRYYEPSGHGAERAVRERLARRRGEDPGRPDGDLEEE
ncbi:MAG: replication-associated recombination protein A [Actinomycetota bacterium]|nr:replication-associated recombination protein A [Actinomycetota bacterium]